MSPGQWRVFGLVLLLLFMEALSHPGVASFLNVLFVKPFKQAGS